MLATTSFEQLGLAQKPLPQRRFRNSWRAIGQKPKMRGEFPARKQEATECYI